MSEKPTVKTEPKQKPQIWKKGQSGNPNGRPKGTLSLVSMLKAKLEEVEPSTKKQYAQLLIDRMTKSAIAEGNDQQIRNILQYVEGMPKQSVDMTSGGKEMSMLVYKPEKYDDPDS